jgi:hypothetical protein
MIRLEVFEIGKILIKFIKILFIRNYNYIFLCVLLFCSCTKSIEGIKNSDKPEIDSYKNITLKSFQKKSDLNNRESENFPTEEEFLNHQSFMVYRIENGDDTSVVYLTPIFRYDTLACTIIGFFDDNRRLLNTVNLPAGISEDGIVKMGVYYIDETHIGDLTCDSLGNVGWEIDTEVEEDTPAGQARSWFACFSDCVDDATYACQQDVTCVSGCFLGFQILYKQEPGILALQQTLY